MNFYGQETGGDGDVRNAYKLHENGKKAAEYLASSRIIGKYSGSRKANLFALRKSVLKMELDLFWYYAEEELCFPKKKVWSVQALQKAERLLKGNGLCRHI